MKKLSQSRIMKSSLYNENSFFFNAVCLIYFLLFLYSFRNVSKVIQSPIVFYLSISCYLIRACEILFMANDWLSSVEFFYSALIYMSFFHLIVFSLLFMYFFIFFLNFLLNFVLETKNI